MENYLDTEPVTEPSSEPVLPIADTDLPPVIREIVTNAPGHMKIPAFVASLSPLCALATRVRLHYYHDTRPSALLLQVIIEGGQASGKSFAADIESLIMDSTLKEHDKAQRRLEQSYRERRRRRGANDRLDEEPKTTIRVIPPTISKTVLTRRADMFDRVYGSPLTFWMFAEELAQVTDAGKQGYSNLRTIMRTAFDLGSKFGLDFASDDSYSAIVDINICSMFCATPGALDRYMNDESVEGGNLTRCILCSLDDSFDDGDELFRPYTADQLYVIKRTLEAVMADTYAPDGTLMPEIQLDLPWLNNMAREWCRQKRQEASLAVSDSLKTFYRRSSVNAFRVAALCYYLYGKEDGLDENARRERCLAVYHFMAEYILRMLMSRWGHRYEEMVVSQNKKNGGKPHKGIFSLLGNEFTRIELKCLMEQHKHTSTVRNIIYSWKQSGHIEDMGDGRYRKSPEYASENPDKQSHDRE